MCVTSSFVSFCFSLRTKTINLCFQVTKLVLWTKKSHLICKIDYRDVENFMIKLMDFQKNSIWYYQILPQKVHTHNKRDWMLKFCSSFPQNRSHKKIFNQYIELQSQKRNKKKVEMRKITLAFGLQVTSTNPREN